MRPRPARSLAPPLRGGPYLNFNGCCGLSPHRTALAPVDGTPHGLQRFAVDFIRIDNLGRGAAGDLTRNESFFTFGEPVYAVADGRVVRTRNDLPDIPPLNEPPGSAFTTETTLGNNIGLKLGGGQYALYAHLKRGSIRVRAGQRVRRAKCSAESETPVKPVARTCTSSSTTGQAQWRPTARPSYSDGSRSPASSPTSRSSLPAPPTPTCAG